MNDDLRCRWMGSDNPRAIIGRHGDDCRRDDCRGCEPCHRAHCRVCGIEHAAGACASCVGTVREDLARIAELCGSLPGEAEVRGVDGEAFNLLGPVTDPEAWGHRAASILSGRIVPMDCDARDIDDVRAWLDRADHERHPLWTVTTWAMCYRDAFGHDEPTTAVNLATEIGYLERNLTYAGALGDVPFEDFARDLRRSLSHLEDVLTAGIRPERSRVSCVNQFCTKKPRLEVKYGRTAADDHYVCPHCDRRYDADAFRDAHASQLKHKGAEKFLPLRDAISTLVAQGRPERTIRSWLAPPKEGADLERATIVGAFCERVTHKVWVWWPDLWRLHNETPTRKRNAA